MTNSKNYNYKDTGQDLTNIPANAHLVYVYNDDTLYYVKSGDQTKLYKYVISTDTETQVDVDPDNDSGDQKSRIRKIQAINSNGVYLWGVDCDNDGVDDTFDVWSLQLSTDTVTDTTSQTAILGYMFVFDIWGNAPTYVLSLDLATLIGTLDVWEVSSDPATNEDSTAIRQNEGSFICSVSGVKYFFTSFENDNTSYLYKYSGGTLTQLYSIGAYHCSSNKSLRSIAYDGNDILYFVMTKNSDSKNYLQAYSITNDTLTEEGEYNVALMLDRNVQGSFPPFTLEKGFNISEDKVYQIPSTYTGKLNWISNFNFSDTIIAITDHYLIDASGNLYEYVDMIAENAIFRAEMYHRRQGYSTMELKYNSDLITIVPQLFLQFIGYHTISGSTNSNQVIFEGIAQKSTGGRVQHALIVNQASEMDQVKAKGSKSGRTDQIISDVNDDGPPNGPSYIQDGTLSAGTAMGDKEVDGKKLRTLYDDYAENDGFTWALRPQGQFDYNDGSVDSGADIRYDVSTYTDTIRHLKTWKVPKVNQYIVNGAINSSAGEPYTGQWDDKEDQQVNGINSRTIEDASLDSNALCQSKADTLGANETEITRCQFKFKKASYGLIQPGQTITFKFDVTNYITINEAQFVVDFIMINLISEVGYMAISSAI